MTWNNVLEEEDNDEGEHTMIKEEIIAHEWKSYWDSKLTKNKLEKGKQQKMIENDKYYMPKYSDYLKKLLYEIPLWSKLIKRRVESNNCEEVMNELTPKNENISNCYAELYFRRKKMNKREQKIPLDQYVRNVWRTRKGLQRQFVDAYTKWNSKNKAVSMKSLKPKVLSEAEKEVESQFSDKEVDSNNENCENDFEESGKKKYN